MMRKFIILLKIAVVCITQAYGQHCTITAYGNGATDTIEICLGDSVALTATHACNDHVFNNNFNDGTYGTGWSSTTPAMFNNPCPPHAPDASTYIWMGSSSSGPRYLTTEDLNVSQGGDISYYMHYAVSGDPTPCNGPEFYNQGMALQYSTDTGTTWITIKYYAPNGDILSYIPTSTTPTVTPGQQTPFTVWTQRTVPIPSSAETSSTRFRWIQPDSVAANSAHWGLNAISITVPPPVVDIWWEHDGYQGSNPPGVAPTNDTTYTVFLSDGTDTVQSHVHVIVNPIPTADFTATPQVCIGDPATITYTGTASPAASYNWNFSGGTVISGTGQGPYEVQWDVANTYDISLVIVEKNCTSPINTVSVDVISCTDIEETTQEYFQIYPNPTSNVLIIENKQHSENMQVKIYSLQGQRLMGKALPVSSSTMLDISSLSQGMYFVVIQGEKHNIVKKITVQRD